MKPTSQALLALAAAATAGYGAERRIVARIRSAPDLFTIDPQWQPPGEATTVAGHDGARLHAVTSGSGPPIVLSHGVLLSVHVWSQMFEPLVAHGFRVIAYDQRGHGRSVPGSAGLTVESLGADLAAVLDHCEAVDALVLGHSMGGIAALSLFDQRLTASSRVAGLVLAGTTPVTLNPPSWLVDAAIALQRRGLFHRTLASPVHGTFFASFGFGPHPAPSLVEATRRMLVESPARTVSAANSGLAGVDLTSVLARVGVPALVICGDRDRIVGRGGSARIVSLIPEARAVWLRHAGHMLPLEVPGSLVEEVVTFSAELGP